MNLISRPALAAAAALAAAVCMPGPARAQFGPPDIVKLTVKAPPALAAGKPAVLQIVLTVKPGFHIQSNTVKAPSIPARLTVQAPAGFRIGAPVFPAARTANVGGDVLSVFEGTTTVRVQVTPPAGASGAKSLTITLAFQACDASSCYPPSKATATLTVKVGAAKKAGKSAAAPGAAASPAAPAAPVAADGLPAGYVLAKLNGFVPPAQFVRFLEAGSTEGSTGNSLTRLLTTNLPLALPLVFLLGLALNLTPCVYPIIPITIGYFGGQASQSGRKPFVLAIFYVLGMAVMYSTLGVVAGLSGGVFGSQLQSPWVLGTFALVMFALALSQFDRPNGLPIWEFQLPAALRNRSGPRSGIPGAIMMGLLVGVVAAPCVGPAVVALLQWVAAQGSPFLGFVVFFTLALGLGTPYIALASVSGSVKKLPRSGEWMIGVKHVFGFLMICMGFNYLQPVLDHVREGAGARSLQAVIVLSACYLLFVDRTGATSRAFTAFKRAASVAALAAVIGMAFGPKPSERIQWKPLTDAAIETAAAAGKPIVIDFTAAWCAQCKELEHKTFPDPAVGKAASAFVALRGDMTDTESAASQAWVKRFGIRGLPTIVRLAPKSTPL